MCRLFGFSFSIDLGLVAIFEVGLFVLMCSFVCRWTCRLCIEDLGLFIRSNIGKNIRQDVKLSFPVHTKGINLHDHATHVADIVISYIWITLSLSKR